MREEPMPRTRGLLAFLAAGLTLALMAAPSGAAEVQKPGPGPLCGTPTATPPPPPAYAPGMVRGVFDSEVGRRNVVPVQNPFGTVVESPTGANAAQSVPPPGTQAPPSVPGLGGPSTAKEEKDSKKKRVEAIQANGQVAEERLLDLGIEIFAPGVDEDDRQKLSRRGISPELRRSEARFVSFHLKKTLEGTGNWGAIRLVPGAGEGLDLVVTGRLHESNGKRLVLDLEARDATGRSWLRKRYRGEADTSAYRQDRVAQEAFQEVYNRIANDLLHARDKLAVDDLEELRRVALLRFAAQLQPQAYVSYLKASSDGDFELLRFPAAEDPMMRRVASIRERDQMFVDTLNEHYLVFYEQMRGPYGDWRKNSYDEQDALDKIARESLMKKIGGGLAILLGSMMQPNSQGAAVARDAAIIGGMIALNKGFEQAQQKGMHQAALKELAASFDADVAPLLVEVQGRQVSLSGSAEKQFVAWREMLREMFALETGLPVDPNAGMVTATPPSF